MAYVALIIAVGILPQHTLNKLFRVASTKMQ